MASGSNPISEAGERVITIVYNESTVIARFAVGAIAALLLLLNTILHIVPGNPLGPSDPLLWFLCLSTAAVPCLAMTFILGSAEEKEGIRSLDYAVLVFVALLLVTGALGSVVKYLVGNDSWIWVMGAFMLGVTFVINIISRWFAVVFFIVCAIVFGLWMWCPTWLRFTNCGVAI